MAVGRIDQYETTLYVGGTLIGVVDDQSGGDVSAKETKYRPGGMGDEVSLGGQTSVGNLTLMRGFDRARDADLVRLMIDGVGKARCIVVKQPLDADSNAFGRSFNYGGVLNKFALSDTKADTNDKDAYTIEVSTDGRIS